MSSPTLGSHPCNRSLKTVAGQVEQWVQRVTDGAEAELEAEKEQRSVDASAA